MSGKESGRSIAAYPIIRAGAKLPEKWQDNLVSCVVDENVGLPDEALVTFRDPDHELLTDNPKLAIGEQLAVSVTATNESGEQKLFTGEITSLELDHDGTGTFTIVRAMSKAHRLMRGRKVQAFQNMAVEQIVRKVVTGAGLRAGRVKTPKRVTYQQLSQANVSDWEFLQQLAQEHGATVQVDENGKLDFLPLDPASGAPAPRTRASASPFVLEYGDNLKALRAVLTSTDQVNSVQVRGWDVQTKTAVVANRPVTSSSTTKPGMTATEATKKFGKGRKLVVTDTPYSTRAEAQAAAGALADSVSAGLGELEAVVNGNTELRAGTPVTLGNAGEKFSGRYTATAVHHVLEPGTGYRTTVLVSTSPDRSLAGLTTGAGAPDPGSRMPGLATGIVTDIKEAGRAQRGWVKLKFPWLDAKYVTDWVRTVQLGGQGGGGVFSPDVNDEVLVGFEQGCLDKPYVLGGLYNGKDSPSEHDLPLVDRRTGKVNRRSLVSRKGHRLELIDGMQGPPGVRIASGNKRLEVRMDERGRSVEIAVKRPGGRGAMSTVSVTDRGITLDAGMGDINLSGRSVSIDAKTTVSVNGKTGANISGGTNASLRAAMVRIN
ncbi:MAG: VgrG-related protein [Saccharopolyspora sp.]|uniref:VgrG-related protein n=1 Tax=Saccharopolyspora sp. TaxID=33915 RepID=UPI0025DD13F8|nr:VgrG-related protein [Saccharopolyspora sp.]MBQ6640707.1 VgrG-related protein [Saccharopolyspora sp.]